MLNVNLYFFDLSNAVPIGRQLASLEIGRCVSCGKVTGKMGAPTSDVQVYAQRRGIACRRGHNAVGPPAAICDLWPMMTGMLKLDKGVINTCPCNCKPGLAALAYLGERHINNKHTTQPLHQSPRYSTRMDEDAAAELEE
jgi:hypothetical protein